MYTPKYIRPHELVPKHIYEHAKKLGNLSKIYFLFNPVVLLTCDLLRKRYGPITINNWQYGGGLQYRAWRPFDCTQGAAFSLHKSGNAIDANFKNATAEEIRQEMLKDGANKKGYRSNTKLAHFEHIHRVEHRLKGKAISWFHFDIGNMYDPEGSIIFLEI
jgi:hypothetical protein